MTPDVADVPGPERRWFRIEDSVLLDWRPSTPAELEEAIARLDLGPGRGFSMTAAFDALTQETRSVRKKVQATHPAIAQYIDALERKLDMLAQAILPGETGMDERHLKTVTLSAGGLCFPSDRPAETGTHIEVRLVLLPSRLALLVGGRVVSCEVETEVPEAHYRVAVEFSPIRETDRQVLVKHVLARQAKQIRRNTQDG